MLDVHCPNWRSYGNPNSYMIPPTFSYNHPDQSDLEYEEDMKRRVEKAEEKKKKHMASDYQAIPDSSSTSKETGHQQTVADYRDGEKAEQIVFDALDEIVKSNFASPMIIVHSLNIGKIKSCISEIFPKCKTADLEKADFLREYDFVIIGPKIGLVVIEVKGSHFTTKNYFKSSAIKYGINQLLSFDSFIRFIQQQPGIQRPKQFPVRKILVLPNLIEFEKDRFNEWKKCMKEWKNIDDVWPGDQTFRSRFYDLLSSSFLPCPFAYETLAPIIAGLSSIVTFKSSNKNTIKLDLLRLLEGAVIKIETDMIQSQNYAPLKTYTHEEKIETEAFNRAFICTPEQKAALAGPNREFIVGVAGTGKTIVLRQKALEVLEKGGKVLILTAPCYVHQFWEFLEQNSQHSNFSVYPWVSYSSNILRYDNVFVNETPLELYTMTNGKDNHIDFVLFIQDRTKSIMETDNGNRVLLERNMSFFKTFDAILIDDACDHSISHRRDDDRFRNVCAAVRLMAYAKVKHPLKTVWVALDILLPEPNVPSGYRQVYSWMMSHFLNNNVEYNFASVVLNRIMRHSDNIFQFLYKSGASLLSELKTQPIMGHKIVGPAVTRLFYPRPTVLSLNSVYETCTSSPEGPDETDALWFAVKRVLDQLMALKIPLSFICILTTEDEMDKVVIPFSHKFEECGISTNWEPMNFSSPQIWKEIKTSTGADILTIKTCFSASSFEWPIVIFCTTLRLFNIDAIDRYRAFSRATTKLFEVSLLSRARTVPVNENE